MNMAKAAAKLIEENVFYSNGEHAKVIIADTTIGRVAEAAACADKFKKAADLHDSFSDYIIKNVIYSAQSGEPIVRHMEYEFPHCGYESINDQFMLGNKILVTPVVNKGETERKVVLPAGKWLYLGKTLYEGGKTVTVPAPIETLPYFVRES